MDFDMPEMTGDEATAIIRELENKHEIEPYRRLNIILCTANVVKNLDTNLYDSKLPKPINMILLEKILSKRR